MTKKTLIITLFFLIHSFAYTQVGIGTTNPDTSAELEITSSNKGLLIPRVVLTGVKDATTIVNPANSLMVYNSSGINLPIGYYYNRNTNANPNITLSWVPVGSKKSIKKANR